MPCWNFVSFPWLNIFRDVSTTTLEITTDDSQSISPIGLPLIDHMEDEYKLRELPLGSHTMMSHGVTVVRTHRYDWLILILLAVMDVVLYVIHPFYRFVGKDMMSDLKYPLKTNTVPAWAVPMYAILLPMVIFLIVYSRRKDVYDLHHAILGLLFSILVTAVITDSIKNAAGRPRPDFFWRCFPDGKDAYDKWGNVMCHGDENAIKEGHKSFPSGHTSGITISISGSFAGLGFLSLYLSGKIKVFDNRGHIAKLCITFLPLLAACLVGISRVDDYWHHWQDVFAGGLLGLVVSSFCYLQFFPPPHDPQGWGPYAYFRALEESKASVLAGSAANRSNSVVMESQVENHEDESNGFMGLRMASYSRLETEDIEGGRSRGNAL